MKTKFEIESTSCEGEFIDIVCVDGSPKADLRSWHITINRDGWPAATAHGVLRRSPDTETAFDDGVDLPPRMVRWVLGSIGVPRKAFDNACDDADCVCRQDVSWPDNIADGCPFDNVTKVDPDYLKLIWGDL